MDQSMFMIIISFRNGAIGAANQSGANNEETQGKRKCGLKPPAIVYFKRKDQAFILTRLLRKCDFFVKK